VVAVSFGVSLRPEGFAEVFDAYPKARFIGLDEYIAYLHAAVQSRGLRLEVVNHPRFGRFFADRPAEWSLHLSGWLRERMAGGDWVMTVDGLPSGFRPQEWTTVRLPPGRAVHRVEIAPAQGR
jgi:hypothetical protein